MTKEDCSIFISLPACLVSFSAEEERAEACFCALAELCLWAKQSQRSGARVCSAWPDGCRGAVISLCALSQNMAAVDGVGRDGAGEWRYRATAEISMSGLLTCL